MYDMYEDEELQRKFKTSFVKNNRFSYAKIEEAIEKGDIEHAHRLVHSIKGNAAQAKIKNLAKIAAEIEAFINNGKLPVPTDKMTAFKKELERVITELMPLLDEEGKNKKTRSLSKEQEQELFVKLKPLLEDGDVECMELLGDVRSIPGTAELVLQIEQYDFAQALKTLEGLKN